MLLSVAGAERLVAGGIAGRMVLAALLLSLPIQFRAFTTDYFGDYQRRSSFRHDSANMAGVVDYVVSAHGLTDPPAIYLSDELGTGNPYSGSFTS